MPERQRLIPIEDIPKLAERLARNKFVQRLSTPDQSESETLAHALSDMEESFTKILDELLPKLLATSPESEAMTDLIQDIREEIRHVVYHIGDSRSFSVLLER